MYELASTFIVQELEKLLLIKMQIPLKQIDATSLWSSQLPLLLASAVWISMQSYAFLV